MAHTIDFFAEINLETGITPKRNWSLKLVDYFTYDKMGFTIADLYNYDIHNSICKNKLSNNGESIILDEYMWDEFTSYLEESRILVYDTYREHGVNECESYFLSLKFVWSTLKKFRSKFFKELDSREDYDKTPLKIAVNHLMHKRLAYIMASKDYKFSAKAANSKLGQFKTNAAWEAAKYLAEETGVIFHAKVTL